MKNISLNWILSILNRSKIPENMYQRMLLILRISTKRVIKRNWKEKSRYKFLNSFNLLYLNSMRDIISRMDLNGRRKRRKRRKRKKRMKRMSIQRWWKWNRWNKRMSWMIIWIFSRMLLKRVSGIRISRSDMSLKKIKLLQVKMFKVRT